jgi:myo-inositol-1(or 4)-monophosphatase
MQKFVVGLVKRAGRELMRYYSKDYSLIRLRGRSKEITTKYDKMIDKMLISALSKRFPDHNILTEESGFIDRGSEFAWVVDSLDGSSNYAVGNPFFSISIALLHLDDPVFGVAYAPLLRELFLAEEGGGCTINGRPAEVTDISRLKDCYLVACEGGERNASRISRINAKLLLKARDVRKLGSGSLECAWVACGRAEAYVTEKIDPWDVAAGVLFVREAGGRVTDFKGGEWAPRRSDLVFSNGRVHDKILMLVSPL